MYSFLNDYSEGAHPLVLEELLKTNHMQTVGYGNDEYCEKARDIILDRIKNKDADVHFLVGGTQTNLTFISHALRDYEAVIATDEGHINVHETGAIEATGHKVLTHLHSDGKLTVEMIDKIVSSHTDEHMVYPKMVYISQTTELGTYYTLEELKNIYEYTSSHGLYLFIDGARLGSAIVLEDAPKFEDLGQYCDAFYIGGTKMGALFGEALVILNNDLKKNFRFQLKQKGAMLAKGRLLGVQFYALLKDCLYEKIGEHENAMADLLREGLKDYEFYCPSRTNQVFVKLPEHVLKHIEKEYKVIPMKTFEDGTILVRMVTSWATQKEEVLKFNEYLKLM